MTSPISARSAPRAPARSIATVRTTAPSRSRLVKASVSPSAPSCLRASVAPSLRRFVASSPSPSAFSLVELLVVIGILALLAGILTPMILKSQSQGKRLRVAADLQAIATALEAYKQDFGDYPRVSGTQTGAQVLCWALVGPGTQAQDGLDGPGFRPRGITGRKYGPYIQVDKFRIADPDEIPDEKPLEYNTPTPGLNPDRLCLIDIFHKPILYFPANTGRRDINLAGGYVSTDEKKSMYDASDNEIYFRRAGETDNSSSVPRIAAMLGDRNGNGAIDATEKAATTEPYLLWSAGPDRRFGTESATPTPEELSDVDDITNFNLQQQ